MKNLTASLLGMILVLQLTCSPARAASKGKDEDRLKESGAVLKEILDVPDDIPKDLLKKRIAW